MMLGKSKLLILTLLTLLSTATFAAVNTSYHATVCGSGNYLFGCSPLTSSKTDSKTLGDSTVTLHLLVAPEKATSYTVSIEPGQTYLFGCQTYDANTTETNTLKQKNCECDSTVTLHLSVVAPPTPVDVTSSYHATIDAGQIYLFGCDSLKAAGTYTNTIPRIGAAGDSTITLYLAVNPAPVAVTSSYHATIEEGEFYLFGCDSLKAAGTYTNTIPRIGAAGDSTITLYLAVNPAPVAVTSSYHATIEEGELYLFGCDSLKAAGTYTNTIPRIGAAGDSTITLYLAVNPAPVDVTSSYHATIKEGELYLFGCDSLKAAGTYTNTIPRIGAAGDSTITLYLAVNPAPVDVTSSYHATIKEGELYLFGCDSLKAAGTYTNTIPRIGAAGDSTITLYLAVTPAAEPITVTYKDTIQVDEYYLFGCTPYTFSESGPQVLTNTLKRTNGADSTIICNLTVAGAGGIVSVSYSATIEDGQIYLFGCDSLKTAGTYTNTLPRIGALGDSIITLNLTVNQTPVDVTSSYHATIDEGQLYLFGCDSLKTAGTYTNTIPRIGALGDSTITLYLAVNPTPVDVTSSYHATIDEGQLYLFGCDSLKTAGTYTNTIPRIGAAGDSTITLYLAVNPVCVTTYGTEPDPGPQCDVYYWEFAGDSAIYTSGTYTHVGKNVGGCDSVVTLTVTINPVYYINATAVVDCDSYYWAEADTTIKESGSFVHVFTSIHGCDSIVTLPVTINPSYDITATAVENCDSYYWAEADTTIKESGSFVHVFTSIHGCDSIVTLPVTINPSYNITATAVVDCDSYYWAEADTTIKESGSFVHVFTSIHGCDSIVTLPVTINKSTVGDTTAIECDQFVWYEHTCTTSGDYTHVFPAGNAVGCDSTLTLHLTINNSVTKTVNVGKRCNMYYWAEADTTIIDGGINSYTHVFQTYQNCDSIVTLTVEIDVPYETTLDIKGYYGDRIIMINRNQINAIPGWHLDSLDTEHPELVEWYRIEASGDTTFLGTGYYYTLPSGDPLPAGVYFAEINLPAVGESCGAIGKTKLYPITASAGAPALMPSYAQPGEDIRVVNLDPMEETIIRVYTAEGALQATYKAHGETTYPIKAAFEQGFYIVELSNSSMKSTLRYIVK